MEANFFLAIKLQPDLIMRAIPYVASTLRSKLKIEIERKCYGNATNVKGRNASKKVENYYIRSLPGTSMDIDKRSTSPTFILRYFAAL